MFLKILGQIFFDLFMIEHFLNIYYALYRAYFERLIEEGQAVSTSAVPVQGIVDSFSMTSITNLDKDSPSSAIIVFSS